MLSFSPGSVVPRFARCVLLGAILFLAGLSVGHVADKPSQRQ